MLLPKLAAVLPKGKPNDYIFSESGSSPLSNSAAEMMLRNYRKQYDLSFTPHQLRHAYATILYDAGVERLDAQMLLGHSSPVDLSVF